MAAPEPPWIIWLEPQPWGGITRRPVRLHAWVRRPDGTRGARISYDDVNGPVEWVCDVTELVEKPGVDYGDVPVVEGEQRRGGRVASGWDWRRTG